MRVFKFIFTAYFILFLCGALFTWGPGANCPLCPPPPLNGPAINMNVATNKASFCKIQTHYKLKLKVEVKPFLRIGSAHNKGRPSDLNIVESPHFFTFSELKPWFIVMIYEHIANQNSVRFSVSIIFYIIRSPKCKQSVCLPYGLDFHFNLKGS